MEEFPFLSSLCFLYAKYGDCGFIAAVKTSLDGDTSVNEVLDYYVQTYPANDGPVAHANKRSSEVVMLPTDSQEKPSKVPRLTNDY